MLEMQLLVAIIVIMVGIELVMLVIRLLLKLLVPKASTLSPKP